MNETVADLRVNYNKGYLLESEAPANPFELFEQFLADAINNSNEIEPNAMTLATTDEQGFPNARIVLLKGFDTEGLVFYTNYNSRKAQELKHNPNVCLVFFWRTIHRQVRIKGRIQRVSAELSDTYFYSRPQLSQAGAIVSPQSSVIPNRDILDNAFADIRENLKATQLERPDHWGGYRVLPHTFEFWQGRPSRLHDRLRYTQQFDESWLLERLAP